MAALVRGVNDTYSSPFRRGYAFIVALAQLLLIFITPIYGGMTDENSAYQRRYAPDLSR